MNSDKAYLLGLVVGGGIFGSDDMFQIRLPYKQWGDIAKNPARAGKIAGDILKVVKPMMKSSYGLDVYYQESAREWLIVIDGDISLLKDELIHYEIKPEGEIRKNATLTGITKDLLDSNLKRRFIAGLADTIGSTAKSHRRFSDEVQIISFEINGFKFNFVCQLCQLLYSVNCYPDQILWNHPNFHSGNDPYYSSWKKGFKLRVELDQYAKFGAFAFRTKAESANENISLQTQTNIAAPCEEKDITVKESCVHVDENYIQLPEEIRGGHYLHNKHICAALGCEHAPYEQIDRLIEYSGKYINPFPILSKGTEAEIKDIVGKHSIYTNRKYTKEKVDVVEIYNLYKKAEKSLIWGNSNECGYPVNVLVQALAFLIAAHYGELNGYRTRGNQDGHIKKYMEEGMPFEIIANIPDLMTPVVLECDGYSAMVGPRNPRIYSKLIRRDEKNKYKIYVREITEDDLNE